MENHGREERAANLVNAHGKMWVKLSEVEVELMRLDGKLELCRSRGLDEGILINQKGWLIGRRDGIRTDMAIASGELEKLGFPADGKKTLVRDAPARGQMAFDLTGK